MKLRVGLVGLGDQWAVRHEPALRAMSDRFEITAVCSEVAEKSQRVAGQFGADATDGFRALVQRDDVDAVLLLSPEWYGPLPIQAACAVGKPVYSSTSLDFTPEQAMAVRRDIRESKIPFMAELHLRYAPATLRLKELIATRLGKPRLLFCHQRLPLESKSDRLRRGKHCPLVWRNMMELVDWCRYIVDADPASIISSAHGNQSGEVQTYYQMASLDFLTCEPSVDSPQQEPIRPLAQLSVGHYIPRAWSDALAFRRPASLQVCCEKGMAFIDLPSSLVWFNDAGQHTESLDAERAIGEMMLDRFYRLATHSMGHSTDAHDADCAMKIVLGGNESIEKGDRVMLNFNRD